jgi:argininosuccinate lyase
MKNEEGGVIISGFAQIAVNYPRAKLAKFEKMKLWQKEQQINEIVERFTIGKDPEFDLQLASWDILGTLAHIKMLESIGLILADELPILQEKLKEIYRQVKAGQFVIEPGVEDIHSQIEIMLTRDLGEVGKKIHSGRSRNDQVLVDLRLLFRSEIVEIVGLTADLFNALLKSAREYQHEHMPGYTHTQVAMVSSFGLWFSAYAETLSDDLRVLLAAYDVINQNPLGSGAGYGSSFPLNRRLTTDLLGFRELNYNVIHAQMGRGKTEQHLSYGLASLASTLGRFATDICFFSNQNFNFLKLPPAFTTGSSIMPHKKNPDVFELIRARCNQLQTLPQQVGSITSNLISGYHRDYQLLKEVIFPALENLKDCIRLTALSLPQLEINRHILDDEKYALLFTVEEVNRLVQKGVPFRDAYHQVALQVENGTFRPDKNIDHTHEGSLGNLCLEEIESKFKKVCSVFEFRSWVTALESLLA